MEGLQGHQQAAALRAIAALAHMSAPQLQQLTNPLHRPMGQKAVIRDEVAIIFFFSAGHARRAKRLHDVVEVPGQPDLP